MKGKRHNFKNLRIWKLGLEISFPISDILLTFPKQEQYDLTSQMSRCSVSIPSNVSEGSAKSDKSFSNYIDILMGSSHELYTQLLVAHHRKYITKDKLQELHNMIEEWQKMTAGFQNSLGK
jgi:four helix bundle protein